MGRVDIIRSYAHRYAIRVFVETGTLTGDTPWALQADFDELHTIDIDPDVYEHACDRFEDTHVSCHLGDSTYVLPAVLATIDQPAVFWLDGHCSGPGTGRGALDTPIMAELDAIRCHFHAPRHVVLIDDARIFAGAPEHDLEPHYADYPTVEWVAGFAVDHGWDFELDHDVMRLTPS